ncbi:MAG: Fe-S cluster assembly protein SufD [Gammaproteobacteria bacterium]|nr:Fe-S cluster assembly protein SufD [Gammaproteobacteria bacterium]MBI5615740.1 Fe-S cluster assembly protein SufD [Gammaproteobacteria bacterium]
MSEFIAALERAFAPGAASSPIGALRRRAFETFAARGVPSLRDEDWKYTDLSRVLAAPCALSPAATASSALPAYVDGAARLVFVNGVYSAALSAAAALPAGVTVHRFDELATRAPDTLAPLLERQATGRAGPFAALSAAFAADGVYVDVAADAAPDSPLHVVFLRTDTAEPAFSAPQLLVSAGHHSRLTLVETHAGGAGSRVSAAVTEIRLADGATVDHYRIVDEPAAASHLGNVYLQPGRDAIATSWSFVVGAGLARVDLHAELAAPGAAVVLNGLFLATGKAHVDHHVRIDHAAPHTTSAQVYKGIANDRGRGVFNGKIVVHPDAQKISATQASNNLLLSDDAEIDTKPELEIYADDVVCQHGATIGRLDDDSLFYLRARGVPRDVAEAMLSYGFADEVVAPVAVPALKAWLEARLTGAAIGREDAA